MNTIKKQLELPIENPPQSKPDEVKKEVTIEKQDKRDKERNRDTGGKLQPAHKLANAIVERLRLKKAQRTARYLFLAVQLVELFMSLSGSL